MFAKVLHGDISQKQRELTLQGFRDGKFRCLVATDVAARGLDIPEIDLVVQCEPPRDIDSLVIAIFLFPSPFIAANVA